MMQAVGYGADPRIRWTEWLPWLAAIAVFFLLPEYLPLGARILVFMLFALSLDLILGYAGIITLGHSAFFGLGAYVAGILAAKFGITDPLLLLAAAALAAGVLGIATGAVILRTHGLALLMLTLAIAAVCLEIANKATPITGGADGLSGIKIDRSSARSGSTCSAGPPMSTASSRCSAAGGWSAGSSTRHSGRR
jgi:branched-chain amino acid transport system permease protein